MNIKKYYISSVLGESGISKYSADFYELILKDRGYIFLESNTNLSNIMTTVRSVDKVHIEIGIFQKKEIKILFSMLAAGYKKVDVTLHDAPLLKYPYRSFSNPFVNNVSKFFDIYINRFSSAKHYVKMINAIYVLSRKGVQITKNVFKVNNVYFLPHIVNADEIKISDVDNNNFIYFGFIGRNKGIEYSLKLHRELLQYHPDSIFYVVGKALGKEKRFYDSLREEYKVNVHYLGYVPEHEVDQIFDKATFSIMPFQSYRFFVPFSGSVIYNQKKGKVVFTTKVNVIPELITHEQNGYFLSGDLSDDTARISAVFTNRHAISQVKKMMYSNLVENYTPKVVSQYILS